MRHASRVSSCMGIVSPLWKLLGIRHTLGFGCSLMWRNVNSATKMNIAGAVLGAQIRGLEGSSSEGFLLGQNDFHVAESSTESESIGHGEIRLTQVVPELCINGVAFLLFGWAKVPQLCHARLGLFGFFLQFICGSKTKLSEGFQLISFPPPSSNANPQGNPPANPPDISPKHPQDEDDTLTTLPRASATSSIALTTSSRASKTSSRASTMSSAPDAWIA